MPSFRFYDFFKENLNIRVVTDHTGKRVFGGRLNLMRSKDDGMCGARRCCSFQVPSAYAFAAMVRRFASTAQVPKPSSDLFSKVFKQPP
jgi:hypothetical protein